MNLPEAARAQWERWRRFSEHVSKPKACPACQSSTIAWNGRSVRSASLLVGEQVVHLTDIVCRRVRCCACRHSWQLRPPGLLPRRHYQLCVVASATSAYVASEAEASQEDIAARHGCSRRTLGRWLRWLSQVAEPAVLGRKLAAALGAPVLPRLELLQGRLRGPLRPAQRELRLRVATLLALFEALAMAWQLEPPGLRAVIERVVGDRDRVSTYAAPVIPELARGHPLRD